MFSPAMVRIRAQPGLCLRIARELGITRGAVSHWRKVPADRVIAVSRLTGIPRSQLRPDIYPPRRNVTVPLMLSGSQPADNVA